MKTTYLRLTKRLEKFGDIPLLFIRLVLAYGFYGPAMMKMNDISSIAGWFESMEMPAPSLMAYLVTYSEFLGFICLALGLGTRFISIPLMITMLVAIKTVHWENGFQSSDNGFEIPLYYLIMLVTLFFYGAGKISADYLISKKVYSTDDSIQY